jgi:hypothetical protein
MSTGGSLPVYSPSLSAVQSALSAPVSIYTKTYSTALSTIANPTMVSLTDSTTGSVSLVLAAVTSAVAGTGSVGICADLAGTNNAIVALRNAVASLNAQLLAAQADMISMKKNDVRIVTDMQGEGLAG